MVQLSADTTDPLESETASKFVEYFEPFLAGANRKMTEVDDLIKKILREAEKCRDIYGLTKTYDEKLFLILVAEFIQKIKECLRKIDHDEKERLKKEAAQEKRLNNQG